MFKTLKQTNQKLELHVGSSIVSFRLIRPIS